MIIDVWLKTPQLVAQMAKKSRLKAKSEEKEVLGGG